MMVPLVKLSLSALRVAVQASLFLEAQRLLLRLVRPSARDRLARAEAHVLRSVRAPISHLWLPDSHGNNIHVLQVPADAAPSRPPLVLLHGHSMSAAFWFRNLDDLVALGYRVYAVDLLGWGRSTRPRFHGKTANDSVDWYLRSLAGVVKSLKLPSFTLVGHSLGAYVSMEYAKRHPDRVNHLVMVSPAAAVRKVPVSRALYFSLPPQRIVRRGGLLGFLLFNLKYPRHEMYIRDRLRDYTYHLAVQHPPSGEAAIVPIIKVRGPRHAECVRPIIEHLSLFRVPVHIVVGEIDSSMPVEGVHDLYREMKRQGFKVNISVVEGSDHCPMLEQPEEFYNIMAALGKAKSVQTLPGVGEEIRIRGVGGDAVNDIQE